MLLAQSIHTTHEPPAMKCDSSIRILVNAVFEHCKAAVKTEIFATILVVIGVLNVMSFKAFCRSIGGSAGNGGRIFPGKRGREMDQLNLENG